MGEIEVQAWDEYVLLKEISVVHFIGHQAFIYSRFIQHHIYV